MPGGGRGADFLLLPPYRVKELVRFWEGPGVGIEQILLLPPYRVKELARFWEGPEVGIEQARRWELVRLR